jgi:hypothetical protein
VRLASGAGLSWTSKRVELYEIEKDPGETVDVSGSHPGLVAKFKVQIDEWIRANEAPYEKLHDQ